MSIPELVAIILQKYAEVPSNKSLLVAVSGIDGSGKGYITEKKHNLLSG
jgi:uridine kinase